MLKVASCDSQSAVYIAENAVYRVIQEGHEDAVSSVLKSVSTLGFKGIIATEVCTDAETLAALMPSAQTLVLKHKKIEYISYPHEWCASMLKDASLFHLELSQKLLPQELFLKDAHPWNILFDKGRPIFVDFTSIVSKDSLFDEAYLESNKFYEESSDQVRLAFLVKEIFERMYKPYFVMALCGYAFGQRSRVMKAIETTTINASTSTISVRDSMPSFIGYRFHLVYSIINKLFGLLKVRIQINNAMKRLTQRKEITAFNSEIHGIVSDIKVEVGTSAYSNYYKLKGEDDAWSYSETWNDKQKTVYNALNNNNNNTVLDVACNTGWFAVLAEKLGKRVVAFDIDEGCIEALYAQVKSEQLDILPLVLNFTEMTQNRYSIVDGKIVLINAAQRLCSDSVIALGIIHHLALGVGLSFKQILDKLLPLCKEQLIIEFIDKDDEMIQGEPSFFPAFSENRDLLTGYNIEELKALIEARGYDVLIEKSHPVTRSILICNKRLIA